MAKDNPQEQEYDYQVLTRFVDKQVLDYQKNRELSTDGQIKDIAVMFVDVRGFTRFAEDNSLQAVNSFLNNFYDIVIHHSQLYGGIVDKFTGDGAMLIFGAFSSQPCTQDNFVQNAVHAASNIINDFTLMTMQKHEPYLFIGVGISYGPAIIGTFGNGDYVNFTAIGHTVNVAARIQSLARNNKALCTKEVAKFLPAYTYRPQRKVILKNVRRAVELFIIEHRAFVVSL